MSQHNQNKQKTQPATERELSPEMQERKKKAQMLYGDQDGNDIDSILKQELEDLGLEYRFIDYKQAKANGGVSRTGWKVYRRDTSDPRLQGINTMTDPDGFVRQKSLVLAVKTKANAERKRQAILKQNKQLSGYTKSVTDELSADAEKLGGSSRVISGYEKNS